MRKELPFRYRVMRGREMAAKMQAMGHEVLYHENVEGGHAGAADNAQRAYLWALVFRFLWGALGEG